MRKITYLFAIILIFVLPWEDSISIPSLGSVARLMGFVLAAVWFATILIEGRFRQPTLFHALVLMFFLWNFVSLFWSSDIENTIQRIKTYSQIFLLMLICWDVFQKPEDLMAGLQAYVLGAYVLVVSTIYNYWAGRVAVQYEARYSATGVNAVDVALILILGLPIGLPIAMQLLLLARRNLVGTLLQVMDLLYIPLSIFAIILTGSRTSLVAIIPFVIYLFLYVVVTPRIKVIQKILIFALFLAFLRILIPYIPPSVLYRLSTIGNSIGGADLGGRIGLWWKGIAVLAEHPLSGVGSGAIDRTIGGAVHNTFISVIAETGFIGFVLFLAILGVVIYRVARLPKRTSELWLTIFMTWAIGVLSLSWEFRKVTWIMLSFMVIESSFQENVEKTEERIARGTIKHPLETGKSVSQPRIS